MKSRYSHIIMLIAAILAFVPVMAVDYLLDGYVRARETGKLQHTVDSLTGELQSSVYDTMASMRRIITLSPSSCTPTFLDNVHREMQGNIYLRQVLVENRDGVQYCDAFGRQVTYSNQSETLSIPGRSETMTLVSLEGSDLPVIKISEPLGGSRMISAFVLVRVASAGSLPAPFTPGSMLRVTLTNGIPLAVHGDETLYDRVSNDGSFVIVNSFAGDIPLRSEAIVPFSTVRADYADLDVGFTIIACLMSGGFLFLALQYVRRTKLPAFDLERAIEAGEIKAYYQPMINLRTGELMGCEVLARWVKRNGDVIPPSTFIDYAEVTGLAIPMTIRLMEQVREDIEDLCLEDRNFKVSINLFEGHFRDGHIIDDVQAIFGGSGISYRQIVFEITERHPIESGGQADAVIGGLHALGVRVAMDDAGTGHSNLAFLHTLGVDIIKIDRVFVDMIEDTTSPVPVLDGLIAMAQDLGAGLVAEGVEKDIQAIYLRKRGVIEAQGYLFAPPLKAEGFREIAAVLRAVGPTDTPSEPEPDSSEEAA